MSADKTLFFNTLPAYVLVFEDDAGGLYVATEGAKQDRAITCFLSPFDALIEAAHLSSLGSPYRVMPASQVDRNLFLDSEGRGLIADMHLGWPARDGRILLQPSGKFGRYYRTMHHWVHDPLAFEVDADTLEEFSRFRELAGLFAWRETSREILSWSDSRLDEVLRRAAQSMKLVPGGPLDFRHLALFDPEFEQWHFVPYSQTA